MKSLFKPVLLAALLATAGLAAYSQAPARGDCAAMMGAGGPMHMMGTDGPMGYGGMGHERKGKMDPVKMQAWMDKRNAELKTRLKLTPAQEGAWTAYAASMKPPADMMAQRPDRTEMDKLPTPERIDRMKALRTQHMNDMNATLDKRGEATKVFYATLTPEQQKVFDTSAMRHRGAQGQRSDSKGPAQPKQ